MGVHHPLPRFAAALGYVATADFVFGGAGLAVALGLTFAPHTHVRPLAPAEIHTTGAPPTVTASAVSTAVAWDPGKDSDGTAPTRACRCSPRTPPAVVGGPSVTTGPQTALSAPVTASSPSVGVPVTPTHTTQGSQGNSAGNGTPTVTAPETTTATTTTAATTADSSPAMTPPTITVTEEEP